MPMAASIMTEERVNRSSSGKRILVWEIWGASYLPSSQFPFELEPPMMLFRYTFWRNVLNVETSEAAQPAFVLAMISAARDQDAADHPS